MNTKQACEGNNKHALTALRITRPDFDHLVRDVAGVELDLEMAMTDEEKMQLEDAKASKTWRALRLAAKTKLSLLDKVDDGKNLKALLPHGGSNIEGGEVTAVGGGIVD